MENNIEILTNHIIEKIKDEPYDKYPNLTMNNEVDEENVEMIASDILHYGEYMSKINSLNTDEETIIRDSMMELNLSYGKPIDLNNNSKKQSKKKQFKINKKTMKKLTKNITKYICHKKDISNIEDYNKEKLIEYIIDIYKEIYKKEEYDDEEEDIEYIEWITNDIAKFIGYRITLEKEKDKKGLKIYDTFDKQIFGITNETQIKEVLTELPFYYLLAFLGNAEYLRREVKESLEKYKK